MPQREAKHRRLRRVLLSSVALLYVASIPWYREGGADPEIWLGLPDWVVVAIGCYVGAALLNAWAWLITDVSDAADSEQRDPR